MREQKEFILSKQVVRSGTSIGANVEEATASLCKKGFYFKNGDFIQKGSRNQLLVEAFER